MIYREQPNSSMSILHVSRALARTLPVSRGLGGKIAYPATTLLLVMVQGDIQTCDFALKAPHAFGASAREGSTMPTATVSSSHPRGSCAGSRARLSTLLAATSSYW